MGTKYCPAIGTAAKKAAAKMGTVTMEALKNV
jgi:hypothetical protein